ncbi:hypothetical protein [uncultured Tateyamaria sp.]|uniref:hypothetical protein n=1 Tax=Tateyamaria sp. 1078 TaxID=3417464 RepID=UPI00260C0D20|nr:hypothetical protein [uncultured Tateyamaria sp.]
MTGIQKTLLAIAAFVAIAVGTFVYFIANWDATRTQPIGATDNAPAFFSFQILRGLGQRPSPALTMRTIA